MTPAIVSAGYIVRSVVSEGSFGTVLKASRLEDHTIVALKAVPKQRLSEKECDTIRKQAIALRSLKHRYIVEFFEDFEDGDHLYHVFEFLHGGDLYDRLEMRGKPFTEAQVLFLARQIFYAVSYLHSRRAAHRDIKLENFVFETSAHSDRQIMKLIDFDLLIVRSKQSPRTETCSDMCGTISYVSPEIASGREHVPEESDIWACGVMLYVLLSYQMPFQGASSRHILRAVRSAEPYFGSAEWASVSSQTKALVKDLLNKHAAERPTAEQALERVKNIQAQGPGSGSRSRLKALTRGLRSVSLNLWDGSGQLARRAARHGAGGDRRGTGATSGPLDQMMSECVSNGDTHSGALESSVSSGHPEGRVHSRGMEETDARQGRKRRDMRSLARGRRSRRIRSQLRRDDEDQSSVSVSSGTVVSSGVTSKDQSDIMVDTSTTDMFGFGVRMTSSRDGRVRESDKGKYKGHEECITSPSLAGMMGTRLRDESESKTIGGSLGGPNDMSVHRDAVGSDHMRPMSGEGSRTTGVTESEVLRSSRRLRKGGGGLGARLRQWMNKA